MRHLLKLSIFCAVVSSMATGSSAQAAKKAPVYKIVIRHGAVGSSWSGPSENDGATHDVEGSSIEIPIVDGKLFTGGQEQLKQFGKRVRHSRTETRREVIAKADAYASSHRSTKIDNYTRTHTTGTVQHNHSGTVNHRTTAQRCGSISCHCNGGTATRSVYSLGGRMYYDCPHNGRVWSNSSLWRHSAYRPNSYYNRHYYWYRNAYVWR